MKLYHGNKKVFAFMTPEQMGELLCGKGLGFGGFRASPEVTLDFAEDGDEEQAQSEGEAFDPSGWHGVEVTAKPFDVEIIHACSYGGYYDYRSEAVYNAMEEANLKPFENADRIKYFAEFVKCYAADFNAINDKGTICVEVPDALLDRVSNM